MSNTDQVISTDAPQHSHKRNASTSDDILPKRRKLDPEAPTAPVAPETSAPIKQTHVRQLSHSDRDAIITAIEPPEPQVQCQTTTTSSVNDTPDAMDITDAPQPEIALDKQALLEQHQADIQAFAQKQAQAFLQKQRDCKERQRQRQELFSKMVDANGARSTRAIRVKDLVIGDGGHRDRDQGRTPRGGRARQLSYSLEASPESDPDAKPYRCDIPGCERKFKKLNGLIAHHQAAHSAGGSDDPKPFKCNVPGCDNAYKNSNGLAYHLENGHGGGGHRIAAKAAIATTPEEPPEKEEKEKEVVEKVEKPWYCPYKGCDKTYKNLKGLAYHLQKGKATGHMVLTEKLGTMNVYVCAITECGKTYKTPQALVEHVETMHADMEPIVVPVQEELPTLECPSCMRPFKSSKGLHEHTAKVHPSDPPASDIATHLSAESFALGTTPSLDDHKPYSAFTYVAPPISNHQHVGHVEEAR